MVCRVSLRVLFYLAFYLSHICIFFFLLSHGSSYGLRDRRVRRPDDERHGGQPVPEESGRLPLPPLCAEHVSGARLRLGKRRDCLLVGCDFGSADALYLEVWCQVAGQGHYHLLIGHDSGHRRICSDVDREKDRETHSSTVARYST